MTSCPTDEKLAGLLADSLGATERDALARHVEGCASCQDKLGKLTGGPQAGTWQRGRRPPQGSEAEEDVVRRLKQLPPLLGSS